MSADRQDLYATVKTQNLKINFSLQMAGAGAVSAPLPNASHIEWKENLSSCAEAVKELQ